MGKMCQRNIDIEMLNRKGQSTVEFAFVILIFFLVFSMLSGLTQIAYNWVVLQYAASEGSRFGSLGKIDEGFITREDSVRNRVTQIAQDLGIDEVMVEFFDQGGGTTAGASSEYYRMKLSRTIQLEGLLGFFLDLAGFGDGQPPIYEVTAWTVIRNEPF